MLTETIGLLFEVLLMTCGDFREDFKASLPVRHSENSIIIMQIVMLYFALFYFYQSESCVACGSHLRQSGSAPD